MAIFFRLFPVPELHLYIMETVKEWLACLSRLRYKRRHRCRKIMVDVEIQQPVSQNLCGDSYPQTKYSESATSKILRQSEYYRVREYIYMLFLEKVLYTTEARFSIVPWFFRRNEYGSHVVKDQVSIYPNRTDQFETEQTGISVIDFSLHHVRAGASLSNAIPLGDCLWLG